MFSAAKDHESGLGSYNISYIIGRFKHPDEGGWVLMTKERANELVNALNNVVALASMRNYVEDTPISFSPLEINTFITLLQALRHPIYANSSKKE